MEELLECPICKKQMTSLVSHIPFTHGISLAEFKQQHPEVKRLILYKRKKQDLPCPYCDRRFALRNGLQMHIKRFHPEHFQIDENNRNIEHAFTCRICGKKVKLMNNHLLLKHQTNWKDYCAKYCEDPGSSQFFFDEEHKRRLMENKKQFYQSERGYNDKLRLREKYMGEGNPAKRQDVKSKISASAARRFTEGYTISSCYSLGFTFEYEGVRHYTRSFEEFRLMHIFLKNKIPFEYEKKVIRYKDEKGIMRNYVLDFVVKGDFIELKCDSRSVDYQQVWKYKQVISILESVGKKLYILEIPEIEKRYGLPPTFKTDTYKFAKQLLDSGKCRISYICRKGRNSRILSAIDPNYRNNPNIHIHSPGEKHETSTD